MGFLSNLLGDKAKEAEKALGKLKDIADVLKGSGSGGSLEQESKKLYKEQSTIQKPAAVYEEEDGPSGKSWGPKMPDEPNQFNYSGTYLQYFSEIFRTEFADCDVALSKSKYGTTDVFTFTKGGQTVLIVELFSRKSSAQWTRNYCRRQGIPYLRYYYDYDGWWNTRSYVIERTRNAIR